MDEACERASNKANSFGWTSIYSAIVSENSTSLWKKESIVVITDYALVFFKKETIELKSAFLWINIQSLALNNTNIEIKFRRKKITISTFLFAKQIYTAIGFVLANVLSNGELKRVKLSQLQTKRKIPTSHAAITRLMQIGSDLEPQLLKTTLNELRKILVPKKPYLCTSEFKNSEYILPYLLKVLKFCTYLKSLRIDHQQHRQSPYDAIIQNVKCIKKLHHLAINGKQETFLKFCESISKEKLDLYAISFRNSLFAPEHIDRLAQLIYDKKITSLQLYDALIPSAVQSIPDVLLTPGVNEVLCVLRIEDTPEINLESLFSKLPPKLISLSLAKNKIFIEDVFNLLTDIPSSLRILDLSQNTCQRMPHSALTLPETISDLRLSNIKWADTSLSNLFQLIWRRGNIELKLDLSNATASDPEWERVFKELETTAVHPLVSLRWDENPVSVSLFRFLLDSIALTELRMNSCFKDGDDFSCLCDLLTMSQSLKLFQSRGTALRSSSNFMLPVIKAAIDSQTLDVFDISGNRIGDEGMRLLESLIQYSPITVLSFDESRSSKGALMSLMDLSFIHKETIKVSFPSKDVEWLIKEGKMKGSEARELIDRFRIREAEQPFENFILKFPFSAPFHIFQYYDWNPSFLSQTEAEQLRANKPGPIKKPEPRPSTPMRGALPEPVTNTARKEVFFTPHPSEIKLTSDSDTDDRPPKIQKVIRTRQIKKIESDESSESDIPIIMPPEPSPDYTQIKTTPPRKESDQTTPPISPLRPVGSFSRSRTRIRNQNSTAATPTPTRTRTRTSPTNGAQAPSTSPRTRREKPKESPVEESKGTPPEVRRTRTRKPRVSDEKTETVIGSKVGVSSIPEPNASSSKLTSLSTLQRVEAPERGQGSTISTGFYPSFDKSPERAYSPTEGEPNPYNPSIRSPRTRRSPPSPLPSSSPKRGNRSIADAIDAMLDDVPAWSPSYIEGSFQNAGDLGSMSSFSQRQNSSLSSLAEVFGTQERSSPRGSILAGGSDESESENENEDVTVDSLYGARVKRANNNTQRTKGTKADMTTGSPRRSPPRVMEADGEITVEQLYGSRVGRR